MNKKYRKIISISGILVPSVWNMSKLDDVKYYGFNNFENTIQYIEKLGKIEMQNKIERFIDVLKEYSYNKFNDKLVSSIIVQKINENLIIVIWINNKENYYLHFYNKNSSHKSTNLFSIAEDIIYQKVITENTISNYENVFIICDPELESKLGFDYSISQPDIALLTILFNNENKPKEFVNRGVGYISKDGKAYGNFYDEAEPKYFKDNPNLKKYSTGIENFDGSFQYKELFNPK